MSVLKKCPNMLKRALSIAVLVPVVLGVLMMGPPVTTIFIVLIIFGFSYEWLKMGDIQTKIEKGLFYGVLLGSVGIFLGGGLKVALAFLFGSAGFVYYWLRTLEARRLKKEKKENLEINLGVHIIQKSKDYGWIFWGLLYIGVPTLSFLWVYEFEKGHQIILWMLFIIWGSDTGAYLIGSLLKGPKIAPSISPKKTWSGFLGGALCGEGVGILTGNGFGFNSRSVFFLALGVVFCAVLGDLFESYLKRQRKVKDTGDFIPGHGGLFDRLDSTLATLPLIALVLWMTNGDFFK